MDSLQGKPEDELETVALTQSFWDIRNYRKVVRRIEDGHKLSSDMMKVIQERIDIENKYTKHLQQWSKKWDEHITKSSEHGTLESGWKSLLLATSRLAEVHCDCQKKLDELLKSVIEWRGDHYHKSIGGRLKESKKADDGFQKAQKPWEKNFDRTNKAKKSYHQVAKELESADNALRNAESNPAEYTQDQMAKLRERQEKAEKEKEKGVRKYKELLDDLLHHKRHYIEDMEREFDKCQAFERIRIEFFKESLLKFKETVDLNTGNKISCIYQVSAHTLNQINPDDDLQWYSLHHGAGMPYVWPEFEEYVAEKITNNSLSRTDVESGSGSSSRSSKEVYPENHIYETAQVWQEPPPMSPVKATPISPSTSSSLGEQGEGELLRALYEYKGEDEDDLSFGVGDVVKVMEYCDGGWAKAFLGDRYGYIPSSYFERVDVED